jgi:hypothetical protein
MTGQALGYVGLDVLHARNAGALATKSGVVIDYNAWLFLSSNAPDQISSNKAASAYH